MRIHVCNANINMCAPVLMCVLWEHECVYNCVNACCMDMCVYLLMCEYVYAM